MCGRVAEEQTEPMKQNTYIAPKNHLAPMECWERSGDAIVDASNGRTASDFIAALKNQSAAAWLAVKKIVVNPVLGEKNIKILIREKKFETDEIFGIFIERMIAKGKLDELREADKLVPFMQQCIRNQVTKCTTKKARLRDGKTVYIDDVYSNPIDINTKEGTNPIDKIPEDEEKVAAREDRLMEDEKAIVRRCFVELWKKHPRQAIVLCLRNMGLSALEIKELIGETTDNNVSQLARRGGLDFADLIRAKKVPMPGVSFKGRVGSRRQKHG